MGSRPHCQGEKNSVSMTQWCHITTLQWSHTEPDGVSNHMPRNCLLNRLYRHRSKKTSKLRVTGLCGGNSLVTGEFPAQRASNVEKVSIWWRHHDMSIKQDIPRQLFILRYDSPSVWAEKMGAAETEMCSRKSWPQCLRHEKPGSFSISCRLHIRDTCMGPAGDSFYWHSSFEIWTCMRNNIL